MKECPRCKITFHLNDRTRCLYCDTILQTIGEDKTDLNRPVDPGFLGIANQPVIKKVVDEHGVKNYTRLQFIVSSYFRSRTFYFLYNFSRNNFLMGSCYKRKLIQPFHSTWLLTLPWVIVNILDSYYCRFRYARYCSKCGWKFFRGENKTEHHHEECEYNREYNQIIEAILKGTILHQEATFKQLAIMKRHAGRKSAYWDLCRKTTTLTPLVDIACIWFSICLWILLIIAIFFPAVIRGVYLLEV